MRTRLALPILLTGVLAIPAAVSGSAAAHPAAHPGAATLKCRTQTYTYTHGKKHVLNSSKGPRVRTAGGGTASLTDNRVVAQYQLIAGGARFLNITTDDPGGFQVSRLESVTLYPVKGKSKRYAIVKNSNRDFVYKYDLLKDYGQVQMPVNGDIGGRATPKLKKVVVTARENCYSGT